MKSDLVVKDNVLINASYNLEVTEQRLILLSIIRARETGQGITTDSRLQIHASDYANRFDVTKEAAYDALKNAVNNLFERKFSYKEYTDNNKEIVVKSRWVSQIAYIEDSAVLEVIFAPAVVPFITRLEKHFTSYQMKQVAQVTSKYGIRLYELLIQWREIGKTPILEINDFRFKLGLEDTEYKNMSDLKRRAIDPAIKQINELTDITVEYEQHKKGRIIAGFEFKFKLKNPSPKGKKAPKDKNKIDMFTTMTDAQVSLFAKKLAHDDGFASQYSEQGESYEAFEIRLRRELMNQGNQKLWADDLKRVGFNN